MKISAIHNNSISFGRSLKPDELEDFKPLEEECKSLTSQTGKSVFIVHDACLPQSPSRNTGVGNISSQDSLEFFKYMTDDQDFEYSNRYYANHIAAKKLMKTYDYNGALGLMKSIEDNKSYPDINMVLLFRVYSDMEICCREITDFENAYRYSTKRLSLLESFRS